MTSTEPRARLPRSATDPGLPGNLLDPRHARPLQVHPALLVPPRHSRGRKRNTTLAVALCAVLPVGAMVAGIGIKLDQDAAAQAAWQARHDNAAALASAYATDQEFFDNRRLAAMTATGDELRAQTLADARAAAEEARALAVAAEHAGADNLAALQAAADALEELADRLGSGASPTAVRDRQAKTTNAGTTVQQAEDAWQQEQLRIQAEQAARAAQEARSRPSTGSSGSSSSPTPPATTWAPGVQSYGIAGLGSVLNQKRAEAGLNTLSVVGSSSLANHAADMAAVGSIWHSGRDHIVGWVEPANDSYMIQAYLDSPPHRAWILKAGVTQVAIGAVTINGVLYTAMVFS